MRTAVIAVVALIVASAASAAEMRLTGSDATASFMPLGLNKSVIVDLPEDVTDVLVANPATVNVVVRSKRRVYVIGTALGQTNIYFFNANSRQIGALNISVVQGSPKSPSESNPYAAPANVIAVYRGMVGTEYSCTPTTCIGPQKTEDAPAPQVAININNGKN
jgi:Pilus formation protein N terminal region